MSTATVEFPIHRNVLSFVGAPRKMLIDGRWLKAVSWKPFPTYNPATGEVLAQVAEGNCADVDTAVAAARKAFESGRRKEYRRARARTDSGMLDGKTQTLVRCIIQRDAAEHCGRGLAGCDAETCKALVGYRAGITAMSEEPISHCSEKLPRYMLPKKGVDPA